MPHSDIVKQIIIIKPLFGNSKLITVNKKVRNVSSLFCK